HRWISFQMLNQVGSGGDFRKKRGFGGRVQKKKAARRRGMDNNGWSHQAVIAAAGRSPDDVAHGCSHRSTSALYAAEGPVVSNISGASGPLAGPERGRRSTPGRIRQPGALAFVRQINGRQR